MLPLKGLKINDLVALEKIAQFEGTRSGQRFLADYEACLQHNAQRIYGVVPAGAAPGFTKATVSAWRVSLEERRLGSSSAIRKLVAEGADHGLLAPGLAQGIGQVKSVK